MVLSTIFPAIHLSILPVTSFLRHHLSSYPFIYAHPSIHPVFYPLAHLSFLLSIHPSNHSGAHPSSCPFTFLSSFLFSFHLSNCSSLLFSHGFSFDSSFTILPSVHSFNPSIFCQFILLSSSSCLSFHSLSFSRVNFLQRLDHTSTHTITLSLSLVYVPFMSGHSGVDP